MVRRLKYEMCKNWREKGTCKYGDKCLFAHGANELTKRSTANGPEPVKAPAAATSTAEKPVETEKKEVASGSNKDTEKEAKITKIFETPVKNDTGNSAEAEVSTPAFSATEKASTQMSTGGYRKVSQEWESVKQEEVPSFSKLSAMAAHEVEASSVDSQHEDKSILNGDLNDLLDREIVAQGTFIPKSVLVQKGCNSTNHSSTNKSPLAAYNDSVDFCQRMTPSKHGSTISQRSSFDDSLNIPAFTNVVSSDGRKMQVEVSPGKIGEGLFAPLMRDEENGSEGGLSSEEENLIAQSTMEIRNFLGNKARPSLLSRFLNVSENHSIDSANQDCISDTSGNFGGRRLRIFQDVTQRSAGKSNETQKVNFQSQCFLD